MTDIETDIRFCARCDGDHDDLVFAPLHNNGSYDDGEGEYLENVWTHWALCPTYQEPIMMKIVEGDGDYDN